MSHGTYGRNFPNWIYISFCSSLVIVSAFLWETLEKVFRVISLSCRSELEEWKILQCLFQGCTQKSTADFGEPTTLSLLCVFPVPSNMHTQFPVRHGIVDVIVMALNSMVELWKVSSVNWRLLPDATWMLCSTSAIVTTASASITDYEKFPKSRKHFMLVLVIWNCSTNAASFLLFVALSSSGIISRKKQVLKCNEMRGATRRPKRAQQQQHGAESMCSDIIGILISLPLISIQLCNVWILSALCAVCISQRARRLAVVSTFLRNNCFSGFPWLRLFSDYNYSRFLHISGKEQPGFVVIRCCAFVFYWSF